MEPKNRGMSEATISASPLAGRSAFLRDRIGSIVAFAPLSLWTGLHLWNNLAVLRGGGAWQEAVTHHANPVAHVFTLLIVLLPLVLHTIWGIKRLASAKPNNVRYGFYANFKYLLQRASAIGVLLFLGAHIWLAMIYPRLVLGHAEAFADIAHEMHHHGPTLAVYLLGSLGVCFHLANGMQSLAMGWGVVSSRKALKKLEFLVIGLFLVLLTMAWTSIFGLYQAGASV